MKKLFVVLFTVALVFMSCEDEPEEKIEKKTTLTINNESGVKIYKVKWRGIVFVDRIYESLNPGTTSTEIVSPGSGYIFLADSHWGDANIYQTVDLVIVGKNENVEFTFTNNTIIKDSLGNNGPIREIMKK